MLRRAPATLALLLVTMLVACHEPPPPSGSLNAQLAAAIDAADPARVEQLIAAGVDVDFSFTTAPTPLRRAAKQGNAEIVGLLLDAGADPNAQGSAGDIALHEAGGYARSSVVSVLLESDADPNIRDDVGRTPLMVAVDTCHSEIVDELLEHGARPELRDVDGYTALHRAVMCPGNVKSLLRAGADPNATLVSVFAFEICPYDCCGRFAQSLMLQSLSRGYEGEDARGMNNDLLSRMIHFVIGGVVGLAIGLGSWLVWFDISTPAWIALGVPALFIGALAAIASIPAPSGDQFFGIAVVAAGDADTDGTDDIAIASFRSNEEDPNGDPTPITRIYSSLTGVPLIGIEVELVDGDPFSIVDCFELRVQLIASCLEQIAQSIPGCQKCVIKCAPAPTP